MYPLKITAFTKLLLSAIIFCIKTMNPFNPDNEQPHERYLYLQDMEDN